jgi:hypothetical protein
MQPPEDNLPVKEMIDAIRLEMGKRGFPTQMMRGRDIISGMLFGSSYSSVIAQAKEGTLLPPRFDHAALQDMRKRFSEDKVLLAVEIANKHFPE